MIRTYIVKQEKGSDIMSAAYKVAEVLFKNPEVDFADRNGWSDEDVFDVSLTDRYWEVFVSNDVSLITRKNADYKFIMSPDDESLQAGLKEVYMIM